MTTDPDIDYIAQAAAWLAAQEAIERAQEHRDEIASPIERRAREVFKAKGIPISGGSIRFDGLVTHAFAQVEVGDFDFAFYDSYENQECGSGYLSLTEMTADLTSLESAARATKRKQDIAKIEAEQRRLAERLAALKDMA